MIELTDTHCHIHSIGSQKGEQTTFKLWSKLEAASIEGLTQAASKSGVTRLIAVGVTLDDSRLAIEVASDHLNIWASIGIHPHEAKDYLESEEKKQAFSALANYHKVVAIGECGLDYYYTHSSKAAQKEVLKFQIELALKNNLPLIFHVREAFNDFWPIFDSYKNIKGVLHSFTDNQHNLNQALKRGLFIGVNGIATFTKDPAQTAVYKQIPLANLLLETDSPFLTPVPLRGKINQPKNVRLVAEYLAELRDESLKTVADHTTKNARRLFNL